jgi:hypothetical protein
MASDLKPCPFCGGEAGYVTCVVGGVETDFDPYAIQCKNVKCLVRPQTPALPKELLAYIWNKRAYT